MDSYLSNTIAIILAVCLLCIVPAFRMYWLQDQVVLNEINIDTRMFANNVRNKGYISKKMYEDFIDSLSKTNRFYDINLVHKKVTYIPTKIGEEGYTKEKPYRVYEDIYCEQQILDTIYTEQKDYFMNKGDDFIVSVKDKTTTGTMVFMKWLGNNTNNLLFTRYGGQINNEDY